MIVCPRCSKENQDHYKFCLGCGGELPRNAAQQPKSFPSHTPPSGMVPTEMARPEADEEAKAPAAAAPAKAAAATAPTSSAAASTVPCPECGSAVPRNFKFCGTCGHPMAKPAKAPAPSAPEAPAAAPSSSAATSAKGKLIVIRPDGSEGGSIELTDSTEVGRSTHPWFSEDLFLSPKHARFSFRGKDLFVRDEGSTNGVFLRIAHEAPVELRDGAVFRVGQELLRFEHIEPPSKQSRPVAMGSPNPGYLGRITLVTGRTSTGNAYCIAPEGIHLGRERGDVVFPDDGYVSGLHCRIHGEGGRVFLTDVGSSNGTFVRVDKEGKVPSGSVLLLGQQLMRAEY